jgi:hypothetical protein
LARKRWRRKEVCGERPWKAHQVWGTDDMAVAQWGSKSKMKRS